jgi:hypothetical protein
MKEVKLKKTRTRRLDAILKTKTNIDSVFDNLLNTPMQLKLRTLLSSSPLLARKLY